jgi:hypothetical protein
LEPPERGRDPDPELEALAEERMASSVRPLTNDEMRRATLGLFATGNGFRRTVVRSALAGCEVPLSEADEYPRPQFGLSDRGTILFRMQRSAAQVDPWRVANNDDKDRWAMSFRAFCEAHITALDQHLANKDGGRE